MSTIDLPSEPMILRVANAIARYIGFGDEPSQPQKVVRSAPVVEQKPPARPHKLHLVHSSAEPSEPEETMPKPGHKWRRHAQLRSYSSPLTEEVRTGRREAVRGLRAASAGALEVAIEHFTNAALCDDVDLTAVPHFWTLTRGQMQTAVEAYERAGRYRDAAALDAHIQTIFRPSLVGSSISPIVPRKQSELAVN